MISLPHHFIGDTAQISGDRKDLCRVRRLSGCDAEIVSNRKIVTTHFAASGSGSALSAPPIEHDYVGVHRSKPFVDERNSSRGNGNEHEKLCAKISANN